MERLGSLSTRKIIYLFLSAVSADANGVHSENPISELLGS